MEEYFTYLDGIRDSGIVNMYGAGEYLEVAYGLDRQEARRVLILWMKTFGDEDVAVRAAKAATIN